MVTRLAVGRSDPSLHRERKERIEQMRIDGWTDGGGGKKEEREAGSKYLRK